MMRVLLVASAALALREVSWPSLNFGRPQSPTQRCVACVNTGDIDGAFEWLEEARRSDDGALRDAWGAVLGALAEFRSPALLRCCETMFHDGLGYGDLDETVRAKLEGLVPPAVADDGAGAAGPAAESPAPPELWVEAGGAVPSVDCRGGARAPRSAARAEARDPPRRRRALARGRLGRADHRRRLPRGARLPGRAAERRELLPRVAPGRRAAASPRRAVVLSGAAAARRLRGERRPNLVYDDADEEHVYAQALAPPALLADVDLGFLTFRGSAPPARLWACRGGVFSPLHYDAQDSHLVQVVGEKRLLLWPPEEAAPAVRRRRRSRRFRVDVPRARRPPSRAAERRGGGRPRRRRGGPGPSGDAAFDLVRGGALEATIGPGDALWFPSDWAHHTESRGDLSIALAIREVEGVVAGA
ncbi:cupin-like domain-containing protein [Aureococcus anophagefferens]|nr:cupin-like domain-containing protein [Aureococcus anophagefferens]